MPDVSLTQITDIVEKALIAEANALFGPGTIDLANPWSGIGNFGGVPNFAIFIAKVWERIAEQLPGIRPKIQLRESQYEGLLGAKKAQETEILLTSIAARRIQEGKSANINHSA